MQRPLRRTLRRHRRSIADQSLCADLDLPRSHGTYCRQLRQPTSVLRRSERHCKRHQSPSRTPPKEFRNHQKPRRADRLEFPLSDAIGASQETRRRSRQRGPATTLTTMSLNAEQLSNDMVAAVKPVLQAHWGRAAPYATAEAQKLAICAVQIEAGYKSGELTAEEAGILRDMQASASRAALTTIETIGLIAAQDAINAALKVLSAAVNKAVGIAIL